MDFETRYKIAEEKETPEKVCIICGDPISAGQFCNNDGCGVTVELIGEDKF